MRSMLVLLCSMVFLSTGCTAGFTGEWLEDGVTGTDGSLVSATGGSRMALSFDPVSGMRYGRYDERYHVVDRLSVQSDAYYVLDGWNKAQFGSMTAHVNGDRMSAGVTGAPERTFKRVSGPSIFPPFVQMPSFTEK